MNLRSMLVTGAAVAAAAIGGAAIASAASSSSPSTSTSTSSGTSTSPPSGIPSRPANMPAPGTTAHEDAEKPVSGSAADKAKAAAIKAVGGGTAGAVTADFTGQGYEVTVTQANGSKVTIHLDKSFTVRPPGGPGTHDGPGGPDPTGAPSGYGPPSGSTAPNGSASTNGISG